MIQAIWKTSIFQTVPSALAYKSGAQKRKKLTEQKLKDGKFPILDSDFTKTN